METNNGPWPLMGVVGAALGLGLAAGLHFLMVYLRRIAPLPLAIAGWLALALGVVLTALCLFYFVSGQDQSGISLMVGIVGVLVLAAVCGITAIHFRRDGIAYSLACGHTMVQFGGAALLSYSIAQFLPRFVAALPGSLPTEDRMVWWFPHFHFAAEWLYGVFLVGLFLLEVFRPLRHLLMKGG